MNLSVNEQMRTLSSEQWIGELDTDVLGYSRMRPKASRPKPALLTATEIAKTYGMTSRKFNKLLEELGIQYRNGNRWYLHSAYANKGYTSYATYYPSDDEANTNTQMRWTKKGQAFLQAFLKEHEILPVSFAQI